MARVEGRTALYVKAHRKVIVARVLASAAVLMDTVKLGAKVNSVPAPAVTSLRTAHAVAQLDTRVLAVPLETAARSTEVAALLLITVRLDARASSELALETAKSHLTQAAEARMAIRAKEVLSEIAVLLPDIVAARRRFVRLVAKLLLVHARPAATGSQRTVIAEAPKDKLVQEVRSETAVPALVAAAARLDTALLGVRAPLESARRRAPTQAAFPQTVHAEGPRNTVSLL
jgi:hypothetical protein